MEKTNIISEVTNIINNSNNDVNNLKVFLSSLNIEDYKLFDKDTIKKLIDIAKDTYYNTGTEIINDTVFDYIESIIGLENNNYVGSKHSGYTVKHSYIMGSLSKVQIKEDKKSGSVHWDIFAEQLKKYFDKADNCNYIEITPKLDGCSFSAEFTVVKDNNGNKKMKFISCATRGDGTYGTDISHWFIPYYKKYWNKIDDACIDILEPGIILCVRGEVLIPYDKFEEKYVNNFANTRSYVAGMLAQKPSEIDKETLENNDLHFVCYDYRLYNPYIKKYTELSWFNSYDADPYKILYKYLDDIGELPDKRYCQVIKYNGTFSGDMLKQIYEEYNNFRLNRTKYALDGIVFKPNIAARKYNEVRERPVDCVAMKFIPMINTTEIVDIIWSVKKTGEYFPKAVVNPVYLDGKELKHASLHNYNYIIKNNCGIGSTVRISLSGDIIPYIYEIVKPAGTDYINLPLDSKVVTEKTGNMHLMKIFNDDNDIEKNQFISSATALNINNIGQATSEMLWENLNDDFEHLSNIIYLMTDDAYKLIEERLGTGKSVVNIINGLKAYKKHLTLDDIIVSFCFKNCGKRASILCSKIIRGCEYSTSGFGQSIYGWAMDKNSEEYKKVITAANLLGIDYTKSDNEDNSSEVKIPVIMTGSPKDFGYNTKSDFLKVNPQYVETTQWSECKILFTDDLNSTSSKMKKALKNGIEIKTYDIV